LKSRLTVLGKSTIRKNYLVVRCDCGTLKEVRADHIRNGKTLSCGCLRVELSRKNNTTHGLSKSSEYKSWATMNRRCSNKDDKRYSDYGGRGISVCTEWKDFNVFMSDMGKKPFVGAQIDRIDNSGGYCKENCRWVSRSENQRNRRANKIITYNGESKPVIEFAERFGIDKSTLSKRISRSKWSVKDALEVPLSRGSHANSNRLRNEPKKEKKK